MSTTSTPTIPEASKQPRPFSVSHTRLATYRRCLQQYHWKYVDGFFPPSSSGQVRGTAGHAALAVWHTDYDINKALEAAWETWETNAQQYGPEWELLEVSLNRYFEWSLQQADTFKVVKAEQEFRIEFEMGQPYWLPDKKGEIQQYDTFLLTGFIDGIVEDQGYHWLLENKFYKRMNNNPLDLDPQVSVYLLAAHLLGYTVQGVIYNIVRVADTKIAVTQPAQRRKLTRNAEGLYRIQEEIFAQVHRMIVYHQKGGGAYRNPTSDCHWDCPFYGACLQYTDTGLIPKEYLISLSQTRRPENVEEEATTLTEQGE